MPQRTRVTVRLIGEFLVIVVGVLVALAADRWNQSRSDGELEAQFLDRLVLEIRSDSLMAHDYVAQTKTIVAARDSLLSYVGGGPAPQRVIATILNARMPLELPVPNAWTEMRSTTSLNILRDPEVRRVISQYYTVDRPFVTVRLDQSDRYAEDPFFDALYQIGWGVRRLDGTLLPPDTAAFRQWAGMRELLVAVGSAHGVRVTFAERLLKVSSSALAQLESLVPE